MKAYFRRYGSRTYGQRWQVETVFSMIKRNFGSSLSARSTHARYRELALRAICHNVAINA
jgi:transposase